MERDTALVAAGIGKADTAFGFLASQVGRSRWEKVAYLPLRRNPAARVQLLRISYAI
jgi:hypothetical protein